MKNGFCEPNPFKYFSFDLPKEPPSLKDLQEAVAAIINASDRNTIRVKDVCQLVAKHFRLSKISEQIKVLIIEHAMHVLKQLIDKSRRNEYGMGSIKYLNNVRI